MFLCTYYFLLCTDRKHPLDLIITGKIVWRVVSVPRSSWYISKKKKHSQKIKSRTRKQGFLVHALNSIYHLAKQALELQGGVLNKPKISQ